MGGHIVLRNIATPGSWFERVVLVCPMLELHTEIMGMPQPLVSLYARLAKGVGLGEKYVRGGSDDPLQNLEFEGNFLTTDRERFQRNRQIERAAPDLLLGSPTVSWLNAAMRSMRMMSDPEFPGRVRVPSTDFRCRT